MVIKKLNILFLPLSLAILKSFLIYLFNYLLFFVEVLSLFLYLLITDLDSFDLSDDFFEEQSNSFKYSVKISLKFIICHSLKTIKLYF